MNGCFGIQSESWEQNKRAADFLTKGSPQSSFVGLNPSNTRPLLDRGQLQHTWGYCCFLNCVEFMVSWKWSCTMAAQSEDKGETLEAKENEQTVHHREKSNPCCLGKSCVDPYMTFHYQSAIWIDCDGDGAASRSDESSLNMICSASRARRCDPY